MDEIVLAGQEIGEGSSQSGSSCCGTQSVLQLSDAEAARLGKAFKALGNPVRLQILDILARHGGQVCVCDVEGHFDLSQPTISHHLRVLREAGLVDSEQRGLWVYYTIRPGGPEMLRSFLQLLK